MTKTVPLSEYLFTRLKQLGVGAIHGVPGDFNLTLLDFVEPTGLTWVGNANELNAGYAADGYARVKGVGALVTTFGVGELSAINAIAGANAERVSVVHIVGVPSRKLQKDRALVHHTFNDGEFGRFGLMAAHVTVGQEKLLDPIEAPRQIDSVLRKCVLQSRPVYIEVPVDMVDVPVDAQALDNTLNLQPESLSNGLDTALERVLEKIYTAKQPLILVDGETRALKIVDEVQGLVEKTGWPTWSSGFGKSIIDESTSNFHGVHLGRFNPKETKEFFSGADLVLFFGAHISTTNSFHHTAVPPTEISISFKDSNVFIDKDTIWDVPIKRLVAKLLRELDTSKIKKYAEYPQLTRNTTLSFSEVKPEQPVSQDKLWKILASFLEPGDVVLGETGTPGYGVREMLLPPKTQLFTFATWLSIGYMLPAAQGAALAQTELIQNSQYHGLKKGRTVLLIGDGSLQMTIQEISTMIKHNLNVVIFVFNNDGYTIERCIHGRNQSYNDVAPWRYLHAPKLFGAPEDSYTKLVKTWGDLENVLGDEKLTKSQGLRMVEVILDRDDAPDGPLALLMNKQKNPKK